MPLLPSSRAVDTVCVSLRAEAGRGMSIGAVANATARGAARW
jgi:hypothetical protein